MYIHIILTLYAIYVFYYLCRVYMHYKISNDVCTYVSTYVILISVFIM